eukprot:2188892-Amphidinium_carterae.1
MLESVHLEQTEFQQFGWLGFLHHEHSPFLKCCNSMVLVCSNILRCPVFASFAFASPQVLVPRKAREKTRSAAVC